VFPRGSLDLQSSFTRMNLNSEIRDVDASVRVCPRRPAVLHGLWSTLRAFHPVHKILSGSGSAVRLCARPFTSLLERSCTTRGERCTRREAQNVPDVIVLSTIDRHGTSSRRVVVRPNGIIDTLRLLSVGRKQTRTPLVRSGRLAVREDATRAHAVHSTDSAGPKKIRSLRDSRLSDLDRHAAARTFPKSVRRSMIAYYSRGQ